MLQAYTQHAVHARKYVCWHLCMQVLLMSLMQGDAGCLGLLLPPVLLAVTSTAASQTFCTVGVDW